MAIVKLTKSGKQVQFVDEEGNVFGAATSMIAKMIQGNNNRLNFILLTKLSRLLQGVSISTPVVASRTKKSRNPLLFNIVLASAMF